MIDKVKEEEEEEIYLLFIIRRCASLVISSDSKSGNVDTVDTEQPRIIIIAMFTAHKIHG